MKRYLTFFFLLITSIALCAYPEGAINNIDGSALGWDEANQVWRPIAVDADGNLKTDSSETTQEISVDTSNIETYLKTMDGEDTVTITDLINGIGTDTKDIKNDLEIDNKTVTELINGIGTDTSNIDNKLKIDNKTIAELVNGIGTDTTNIENNLKVDDKTVTELVNGIGTDTKNISNKLTYEVRSDVFPYDVTATYDASTLLYMIYEQLQQQSSIQPQHFYTIRHSVNANSPYQILGLGSSSIDNERVFVELRAVNPDDEYYIAFDAVMTDANARPVKGRILLNMPKDQQLYVYHTNASALAIQQTEGWR